MSKLNKIIWGIFIVLLVIFLLIVLTSKKSQEYIYKINGLNKTFYLKFVTNDKITKIANLINREKHIDGIINLYDIKNNKEDKEYLVIDKELYYLLDTGLKWHQISDYIDIGMGNLVDYWFDNFINQHYDTKDIESDIENLELKDGKIKNNRLNLYLDDIAIGYVVDEIGKIFKQNKIKTYFINTDNIVLMGQGINNNFYNVAIKEPNGVTGSVYQYLKLKNKAYASIDYYDRIKKIGDNDYTFYINPLTKEPEKNIYGTTVIGKNALESNILSLISFYSKEDSKDLLKKYHSEAIWYYDKDNIEMTDGFKKYQYRK